MKTSKIAYKPVGLVLGATSGMIAGAAFKQAWKILGRHDDAPDATDEHRTWQECTGRRSARCPGAGSTGVSSPPEPEPHKTTAGRPGLVCSTRTCGGEQQTWC
ncbi:DUF4235 domain-containing protein [Streptomyces xanthophaeus]|uniref:DUF4235 domain-containing protein n=1 Tax=Streptomyces xanthophaeus TaxID=67385 RepID=UPI0037138DAF